MHSRTPNIMEFNPPVYQCKRAKGTLVPDGDIDKPFWAEAQWTGDFQDIEGHIRPQPRFRTRAKMLWDDKNIYFAAELTGNEIWAHVTKRDDVIFRDNDFEIFIDPDSDTQCYYEFEMNARNTVWDLLLTKAYRDGGKAVNGYDIGGLKTAVKIDGELNNPSAKNIRWCCEIVMPFEALCVEQNKKAPAPGEFWRVNFSRVQWKVDVNGGEYIKKTDNKGRLLPEDNWVWSPTGIVDIHYPELWGFVFFCRGSEEYTVPKEELIKWELRRYYYAEHAYFAGNGGYTETPLVPGSGIVPKVQITDHSFEISYTVNHQTITVFNDGRAAVFTEAGKGVN